MSTNTQPQPATTGTGGDDELHHAWCCDEDVALCGTDISDAETTDGEGWLHCVVCVELEAADVPCPKCPDYGL